MNVVITGTNFVNKGAELMMHAALDELRTWPEVESIAMPIESGSQSQRRASGIQTVIARKVDRSPPLEEVLVRVGNAIPARLAERLGVMRARDVDLVLDASGYIYSDRSGPRPSRRSLRAYRRYKRAGAQVILLPQAFGPFEDARVRSAFHGVLGSVTLAFARDPESLDHLQSAAPASLAVALAPDFTIPSHGAAPAELVERYRGRACLVPNARMLRDTDDATGAWYLDVMVRAAERFGELRLEPFLLLHEAGDAGIAEEIRARASRPIELVSNADPRALKAVIGAAHLTVASRYHALVGALSSAVPAVGIGWSHKYAALFSDFASPDLCIANGTPADSILEVVSRLASPDGRAAAADTLSARSASLAAQVTAMWTRVRADARGRERRAA